MGTEGFITYNKPANMFSKQTVGIYSSANDITKIYDDIYYDPRNGNIVVIYTNDQWAQDSDTDIDGKSIKLIEIAPRKNNSTNQVTQYTNTNAGNTAVSQNTIESQVRNLETIDIEWSLKSDRNQVNYFTWGKNTYIYVMDISGLSLGGDFGSDLVEAQYNEKIDGNSFSGTVKHAAAVFYTGETNANTAIDFTTAPEGDSNSDIYITNSYPRQTDNGYDDKSWIDPVYHPSRPVYQITSTIKYDVATGNLLIITPTTTPNTIDVYYRSGDMREDDISPDITLSTVATSDAPHAKRPFSKSVSKPFFVQDYHNRNTVMYWPTGENTLIAVFENRNSNGYIPIKKTVRFTSSGVWTSPDTTPPPKTGDNKDSSGNLDISGGQGGNYGDFWKWWSYFNSNAVGGVSNDYMLKTQIVPPVCPSCPACQGGACTNCGGQGGSGSMSSDGSSLAVKGPSAAIASLGQSAGQTITGTAAAAGLTAVGAGAVAGNVISKTVDTAGNIVGKTVDTAGNVINRTFDAAGNIVDKTFDAAGGVANATGNLLYSAGSGVSNLLSSDPTRVGYEQSYRGPRAGSNNTGIYQPLPAQQQKGGSQIDPYTYNGALQSKGGNFRPVTTDFSSFGL